MEHTWTMHGNESLEACRLLNKDLGNQANERSPYVAINVRPTNIVNY